MPKRKHPLPNRLANQSDSSHPYLNRSPRGYEVRGYVSGMKRGFGVYDRSSKLLVVFRTQWNAIVFMNYADSRRLSPAKLSKFLARCLEYNLSLCTDKDLYPPT